MVVYCNDDGSNTSPYETLAKAATTFLVAVDQLVAGEDLLIGMDHSETPTNPTYTFPGTDAAPNRVISINTTTEDYDKADNIQIDVDSLGDMDIVGHVKFYGISIRVGDDLTTDTINSSILFDDSVIELDRTTATWGFGHATGKNALLLKNTAVNFSGGGANTRFNPADSGAFDWKGGTLLHGGTQPSALFAGFARIMFLSISGVDLSSITTALIDVSAGTPQVELHHNLLASGVALTIGTIAIANTKVLMSGCDDTTGNDLYRLEYVDYYGAVVHDDAIFVTSGGASDGTTPISWKMVTTANATEFSEPLISPPITIWADSTGSQTFTVQCLWDSLTDIQNDEIWLEIEYLSASADTESDFANDGLANVLATPADQTTNSTAWTESLTNDNEFAIAVTATINRVGPVICRVHLAKPSTTVYIDPKVTVT